MSNLDRAIDAAAQRLHRYYAKPWTREAARMAVEAAAPHIRREVLTYVNTCLDRDTELLVRAERAEAEVERLERHIGNIDKRAALAERALADRLAEALMGSTSKTLALAEWEERRAQ